MNVVGITDARRDELVEVFHGLIAKAEDEGPFDVALCMTDRRGQEFMVLIGRYERDPAALAQAGFRFQYRAMAAANEERM